MGMPLISRYCFGSESPMRVPVPAAGTIATTRLFLVFVVGIGDYYRTAQRSTKANKLRP
jgi:hypothetical protein